MSTQPLTPAEAAVVEVLEGKSECSWHIGCDAEECYEPRARAVVAAVRSSIEADLLDALADAAADYGPPSVDHLRGIAYIARQGRSAIDWLAESTARPTSEEH